MSQASERRLAALRAANPNAEVHTDTGARVGSNRSGAPVAAPARRRARKTRRPSHFAGASCGAPGCINGCHDCE